MSSFRTSCGLYDEGGHGVIVKFQERLEVCMMRGSWGHI